MKKKEPYVVRMTRTYDKKIEELREWFGLSEKEEIEFIRDVGDRIVVSTYETVVDKRNL